ncbi:MAG TPA: phage tail protein [Rheinheimera sp.]|nr:phage tail protein [Rheinheimera sp.]
MQHTPIKVEKIGKRRWRLVESWRGVPAGFETDGASVPRIFWWFMDPASEAFEAAVLHDHALRRHNPAAHRIFLRTLIEYRVPTWRALIAYFAVWLWGLL